MEYIYIYIFVCIIYIYTINVQLLIQISHLVAWVALIGGMRKKTMQKVLPRDCKAELLHLDSNNGNWPIVLCHCLLCGSVSDLAVERAEHILFRQGFISWRTRSSPEVLFIFQVLCKESPEQWINWQERLKSKQCFLHSCVLRDAKDEEMAVFSRGHSGTAASWQQKHELFSNIWWLMFLTSWECRGVWDFSFQWGFRTRCARPYPKSRIVFIFQVERESECKLVRWKGNQSAIALERFGFGFGFHNI